MSGHTSSQITVQEQHHTAPIQTQSHATQQQISQTRTTATPSDPFSEFKPKKRDKPITLVRQDGANCGCFAAGMAIASLIPKSQVAQLHKSYKSKFKPNEDESDTVWFSNFVAKRIQDTAQKLNLSAIGEMFDAKALFLLCTERDNGLPSFLTSASLRGAFYVLWSTRQKITSPAGAQAAPPAGAGRFPSTRPLPTGKTTRP